jgi:transglutaminase-like putative cysteine protease
MKYTIVVVLVCLLNSAFGQRDDFEFGKVSLTEMHATGYAKDTSANAIVLQEFGHALVQYVDDITMFYKYHVRIKILKPEGLERADVSIFLYKDKGSAKAERLRSVQASSFNIEDGVIRETKLIQRDVKTEEFDKNWDTKRFAISNVKVGSVIEYEYELETPQPWFFSKFKQWKFQSDIPKIYSAYWATIPGNWRYNISLRGALPLKKNESELLKDCFRVPAGSAECARYRWAMSDIPAFYEEEYMTSSKNFLSTVNFELLQIEHFNGRRDKVTKEWKDVEQELRTDDRFGAQLRRGEDVVDEKISQLITSETDPVARARQIYDFIRGYYTWNERNGYYTETGIKKAFEARKGNVGDINISLIAALRHGGLDAEPMLLSTRENGLPTELYPVLTEFNYVVAKLNIDGKSYLLDATDDVLPFGLLPRRCLNGKGRVFGDKESYWYDIKTSERARHIAMVELAIDEAGSMTGTVKNTYSGYKAADIRRSIYSHPSVKEYISELKKDNHNFEIVDFSYANLEDFSKPLIETLTLKLINFEMGDIKTVLFNPYIVGRWQKNPFHLTERVYPVDFGTPIEETMIFSLQYPPGVKISEVPQKTAMGLPNNGGRFVYDATVNGQKLSLTSSLIIGRTIFFSDEYPALKEFFNRVVKIQGTDLIFEKL